MIQQSLVKVNVEEVYPQKTSTAHAGGFCRCDDGMDYAYKASHPDHRHVPAAEWLCTSLAQACRIATPPFEIIFSENGEPWFGSRIEGGKLDEDDCLLALQAGEMGGKISNLKERLSSIFALDLFLNNIDRHGKNYLFRTSLDRVVLLAFDFSFAWLAHGPQLRGLPAENTNTMMAHRFLERVYGFDAPVALRMIDSIASLPENWIVPSAAAIPEQWKQGNEIDLAVEWWASQERLDRCEQLRGVFK